VTEEKTFKIKVVKAETMSHIVQAKIAKQVQGMSEDFIKKYCGFVKVTYITASPARMKTVEPIEGTVTDYFREIEQGLNVPVF